MSHLRHHEQQDSTGGSRSGELLAQASQPRRQQRQHHRHQQQQQQDFSHGAATFPSTIMTATAQTAQMPAPLPDAVCVDTGMHDLSLATGVVDSYQPSSGLLNRTMRGQAEHTSTTTGSSIDGNASNADVLHNTISDVKKIRSGSKKKKKFNSSDDDNSEGSDKFIAKLSPPGSAATKNSQESARAESETIVTAMNSFISDISNGDSGEGNSNNMDMILDIILSRMKEHRSNAIVQLYCLEYLWNSCTTNEENSRHIASSSSGALTSIIQSMMEHKLNPEILEQACGTLWSVAAANAADYQKLVVRSGAFEPVMEAVERHFENSNLVRIAMGCLQNLSPDAIVRSYLRSGDGNIAIICNAMSRHLSDVGIQKHGCACLSNSAVDMERQRVEVATRDELNTVVSALIAHEHDPDVVKEACAALQHYTWSNHEENLRTLKAVHGVEDCLQRVATANPTDDRGIYANTVLNRLRNMKEEIASLSWSCPTCTFLNSGLLTECELCETPHLQAGT